MKYELFKSVTIAVSLFASLSSHADAGSGARGGGDAYSDNIAEIAKWIGPSGSAIRPLLTQIVSNVVKFAPQGVASGQVRAMYDAGLLADIAQAPYELKPMCVDEQGIEKDASTLKVDLGREPNQPRPAICINMPKLARQGVMLKQLVALLLHEHARHFGLEDTNSFGAHPIAAFVIKHYIPLNYPLLTRARAVLGNAAIVDQGYLPGWIVILTTDVRSLRLGIDKLFGECNQGKVLVQDRNGYSNDDIGSALPGMMYDLSVNPRNRSDQQLELMYFQQNKSCKAQFKIENATESRTLNNKQSFSNDGWVTIKVLELNLSDAI